jgi:hypothetical protein
VWDDSRAESDTRTQQISIVLGKAGGFPDEKREHVAKCILPFLDKLPTEDHIEFAIEVLALISDNEREGIINYLLPFIDKLDDGYTIIRLIRQLAGIPDFERKNVILCMQSFIDKIQINQIENVLKGLCGIPNEKREIVSIYLLIFINQMNDDYQITDACKYLAKISDKKRENIASYLIPRVDQLDRPWIFYLLEKLVEVPDEENIIRYLCIFDHKLQTGRQILSMIYCLSNISTDQRENVISSAWHLFDHLDNYEIESVLKALTEIPEEKRETLIDFVLLRISRLRGSDIAPALNALAEIPDNDREKSFNHALSLLDMEITEGTNVRPAWMFFSKHEAFLALFNKTKHSIKVPKPEVMQYFVRHLELKGSLPTGRCLVSTNKQVFQQQFTENQEKFDKPFSFLLLEGSHWSNITVQKKCVICSDATGNSSPTTETEMGRYIKRWAPAYELKHISPKRQVDFVSCWVFALRDAVELLRMKDIQTLVNNEQQLDTPPELLKSMQSTSFFKDSAILNKTIKTRKKGIVQIQPFGDFLNRHKKIKNKKNQNCYIDDRREKYEEILINSLPIIQPEQECSVSTFKNRFSQFVLESAVTYCIDRQKTPILKYLLPFTAKQLPIDKLLRASSLLYRSS